MLQRQLGCRGKNREGITLLEASIRVRVRVRVARSMKVNVCKHRKAEQAKEADMLEPKGMRPGWDFLTSAHGDDAPPVYVTDLRHSSIVKGRNVVSPYIRLWAHRQVKPQGTLMGMQVKDPGESECRSVMDRIRVATSPGPKGSRLPGGA
jgi:hypothetical protein